MTAWTKGMLASGISGAAGGVVNAFSAIGIAPQTFNLHPGVGLHSTLLFSGAGAIMSAILGLGMYLAKSPLPGVNA